MPSKQNRDPGNTLSEYGIILGLVGVLAIAGLNLFGGTVQKLVNGQATEMASGKVRSMARMDFGKGSASGNRGGGAGGVGSNDMNMPLLDGSGFSTNTTSTEGATAISVNTVAVANELQEASKTLTSKAARTWATELAKLAYNLGGAEGHLAGIEELTIVATQSEDDDEGGIQLGLAGLSIGGNDNDTSQSNYTDGNAYIDIYDYQKQMAALMQNPPKGVSAEEAAYIQSLAASAVTQAQPYVEKVSPYVSGKRINEQRLSRDLDQKIGRSSYDQLVDYNTLTRAADKVVSSGVAEGTAPDGTLEDAQALDQSATATPKP